MRLFQKITENVQPVYVLVFLLISVSAGYARIAIIENTPEKLIFSWKLSSIDTASFESDKGTVTSLTFQESDIAVGRHGEPLLPGYSINLGVPAGGEITVSFVPSTTKKIRLHHPLMVRYDPENRTGNEDIVFNGGWTSQPGYSSYRTMRVARTVLRPVTYENGSKTAVIVTGGTGTVIFPKAPHRPTVRPGGSDFEAMLRKVLINYDVAAGWHRPAGVGKRAAASYPLPYTSKIYSFKIGDGHSGFNEATINENGILKITGSKIRELFETVRCSRVRLFAACKRMLPDTLPNDNSIPDGVKEVPVLRCDNNGNDTMDTGDCLYAYVSGSSDWMADTGYREHRFHLDLYDDFRTYWLTVSGSEGMTMETWRGGPFTADTSVSHFTNIVRLKQSTMRREGNPGDREWLWKVLSDRYRFFEFQLDLPGLESDVEGWFRFRGNTKYGGKFSFELGGERQCDECTLYDTYNVTSWGDGKVDLAFQEKDDEKSRIELEYIDVGYRRELVVPDEPVVLSVMPSFADSGRVISYNLSLETEQTVYVFRVPEDERHISLVDTVRGDGSIYEWVDTVDVFVRYVICNEAALIDLPDVTDPSEHQVTGSNVVRNLRSGSNEADFLIIAHEDFLNAADSLAGHKKRVGFSHPAVVDVDDIYRFFSGGDKDVMAIRNFVGYVSRFWKNGGSLDYVLLVGVGHYDAKNLTASAPDFVPVYIHRDESIENFFTRIIPDSEIPQLAIGRLPCTTRDQAWAMVRKIVTTEDPKYADYSEWRNRMLFVADDDMQGKDYDQVASSTPHHLSSDRTATVVDTLWPSIDIRKVYLYEYEWDQSLQKPGASRALINQINNGVGYINFFGHGADVTWTDEYILTGDMVAGMNNAGRYPVVSAFSCSVGKFDVPGTECLSGILAKSAGVGSIASISSTREAYANANENLAKSFYSFLFDTTAVRSIGMAMMAAQTKSSSGHNTYCILGDPSIRAVRPTHRIKLSVKDGKKTLDTISAFQKVTLTGSVQKLSGAVDRKFDGNNAFVALGLFNAPDTAARKDGGEHQEVRYVLPGRPVFLGKTSVADGRFSQEVLIPQNVSFNKPGVKLTAYAWREGRKDAGIGYKTDLIFSGSVPPDEQKDSTGPKITIRPAYDNERLSGGEASFSDHITSQPPVRFEIELYDENGIDVAGTGPDEGVTLEIKGVFARQNVNNKFQFKEGDYRRGIVSLVYEEDALKPGEYQVLVTGRDLFGNLAKAAFTLNVTEYDELVLDHVLNFPNPMRMKEGTHFYCHTNYNSHELYSADLRLTIKIYSLGGRLLKVIPDAANGQYWDGRDQAGNILTPDVYLYQFTAEDLIQRKTKKSKIMKLVVHPPR